MRSLSSPSPYQTMSTLFARTCPQQPRMRPDPSPRLRLHSRPRRQSQVQKYLRALQTLSRRRSGSLSSRRRRGICTPHSRPVRAPRCSQGRRRTVGGPGRKERGAMTSQCRSYSACCRGLPRRLLRRRLGRCSRTARVSGDANGQPHAARIPDRGRTSDMTGT